MRDFQGKCVNLGCSLWGSRLRISCWSKNSSDLLGGHCDDFVRNLSRQTHTRDAEKVQMATSSRKQFIKSLSVAEGKLEVVYDFYQTKKSSGANLTSRASMTSSCFSFPPIVLVALTWFLFSRSKTSKTSDTGRTNCILPDMKTATFWKPRIYPTLKDAFFSWWRFFTSGRVKCSYWFTNHIHFSMVGTLVLVSFCVHIWLISAVRSTKKVTLQKKNLRCPHFWATIIHATFGWIDPKKVNSWIHPTVKSVELISWWKREKLLTFVERWDSKGGDNAEIKDVCMLWGWNLIIF